VLAPKAPLRAAGDRDRRYLGLEPPAVADGEVHEKEVQWVKAVAVANGIEEELFNGVVARALAGAGTGTQGTFEAGRFEWD